MNNKEIIKDIMSTDFSVKRADKARSEVLRMRRLLQVSLDTPDDCGEIKYTGQMVLLKKLGESFEFVGIWDGENFQDGIEPEWDICLPIPVIETIPEFEGW